MIIMICFSIRNSNPVCLFHGEASMKMVIRTTSGSSKSGLEAAESVPWYLHPLESKRGNKTYGQFGMLVINREKMLTVSPVQIFWMTSNIYCSDGKKTKGARISNQSSEGNPSLSVPQFCKKCHKSAADGSSVFICKNKPMWQFMKVSTSVPPLGLRFGSLRPTSQIHDDIYTRRIYSLYSYARTWFRQTQVERCSSGLKVCIQWIIQWIHWINRLLYL